MYDLSDALGLFLDDGLRIENKKEIGSTKRILEKNDVIISRLRSYLKEIAFVFDNKNLKLASTEFFAFRRKKNTNIFPELLFSFLQTNIVQKILEWSQEGVNHPRFSENAILELKLPDVLLKQQDKIKQLVETGHNLYLDSKSLYQQAESLLLEELKLKDFEKDERLFSVVSLLEVENANRMDAEYFHGDYEKIVDKVEKYSGGCNFLENLTSFINNGNQPPYSTDGEIKFFSQKWIKDKGIDYSFLTDENEPRVLKSFFEDKKNAPYLIKKYDILYYSVGANLGYCHNYLEDESIAIGSFINLIRPNEKKINSIYLGFLLNSIVGRAQSERDKSGLAQPYIYAKNLRKFKIPILPKETQRKIAGLVQKSHMSRKKAKELLEESKRKVEDVIENN